jgi:hypothetical protein
MTAARQQSQISHSMSQRSPVNSWLLLAATLAVYAVAGSWAVSQPFPTPPNAWIAFDALTFSMLSLVCMWTMFFPYKSAWWRIAPVVAVVLASLLVTAVVRNPEFWGQFRSLLPIYGFHVALLLFALWVLKRINFWQRRFGNVRTWQFSVADLLIVMTVVAVLAGGTRYSLIVSDMGGLIIALIVCTVTLAVASAVLWSLSLHWIVRFAGTMGAAPLLGWAFGGVANQGDAFTRLFGADLLIQAAILSIWLGIGDILPTTAIAPDGDVPTPPP